MADNLEGSPFNGEPPNDLEEFNSFDEFMATGGESNEHDLVTSLALPAYGEITSNLNEAGELTHEFQSFDPSFDEFMATGGEASANLNEAGELTHDSQSFDELTRSIGGFNEHDPANSWVFTDPNSIDFTQAPQTPAIATIQTPPADYFTSKPFEQPINQWPTHGASQQPEGPSQALTLPYDLTDFATTDEGLRQLMEALAPTSPDPTTANAGLHPLPKNLAWQPPAHPSGQESGENNMVPAVRIRQILPDFPEPKIPLPPNISLEEICWSYPNHLYGSTLRPFIAAGWTGLKIFENLQDSVKKTCSATRPWNKMVQRVAREKDRIEAEHKSQASRTTADAVGWPLGGTVTSPTNADLPGNQIYDSFPSTSGSLGQGFTSSSVLSYATTNDAIKLGLTKQDRGIEKFFRRCDPAWHLITSEFQLFLIRDSWLAFASEQVTKLTQQAGVSADCLPPGDCTQMGMLRRLWTAIEYSGKTSLDIIDETMTGIVQSWTKLMEQHFQNAPLPQLWAIAPRTSFAISTFTKEWAKWESENAVSWVDTLSNLAAYSRHLTAPNGTTSSGLQGSTSENRRPRAGEDDEDETGQPPRKRQRNTLASQELNEQGLRRVVVPRNGSPQLRMFPDAPARDTPLPPSAIMDCDHMLDHYPEHLANTQVMLVFYRQLGATTGGYPTELIVKHLIRHRNAYDRIDGSTPCLLDRTRIVANWVQRKKGLASRLEIDDPDSLLGAALGEGA